MDKLAIDGGPRAITLDQDKLLRWPVMGSEEEEAVLGLLRKGDISQSGVVDEFAREFTKFAGTKYALPQVNGTACLLSAFFAIGIKPGDEVIAPTNTYWASVMPAAFLGARIVFCESEKASLGIDPEDVKKKVTPKTRAIVPVHLYGYPCDMDPIMELADERGIAVVEDASHAHGAQYKGKNVGTFGRCAAFSLQGSKVMPAGEAGVLVTDDVETYEKAVALGHYERLSGLDRDMYKKYKRTGLGLKHRLSPLHAAIALCQLKKFPEVNGRITRNCERFREGIKGIEGTGFYLPDIPKHVKRGYFMNQVVYDDGPGTIPRGELVQVLATEGLRVGQSRYELLHKQPYFEELGHDPKALQFTENLVSSLVSFPNFPWDEKGELVDQYVHGIEKVAHYLRE
ncbi:MAG: DegT/DnrJ/EryC1/StrS family aminotransferase [Candidatus Lokiarchaeota archaeon]|nr:DegT/DnrJ/EryC1/StrS family aminotransferase [Candidatus Lokiarchaeota archaeon]